MTNSLKINTVKLIFFDEVHNGFDEGSPVCGSRDGGGEEARASPPAHRNQGFYVLMKRESP